MSSSRLCQPTNHRPAGQSRLGRGGRLALVMGSLLLSNGAAPAQQPLTENVLTAGESQVRPAAGLAELAWMAGRWTGSGLGAQAEEIWSTPKGGAMMGMFRQVAAEEGADAKPAEAVRFYELMTLAEQDGSLVMRIKHFRPDMRGWEEKDQVVEFRLLKVDEDRWSFNGLTIQRLPPATPAGPNRMRIFVAIGDDDATRPPQEALFEYQQAALP